MKFGRRRQQPKPAPAAHLPRPGAHRVEELTEAGWVVDPVEYGLAAAFARVDALRQEGRIAQVH